MTRSLADSTEIFDVRGPRTPVGVARPFLGAPGHVMAIAHAEQKGTLGPGNPFVQFAGWVHDKRARNHRHGLVRRLHRAAALEAEIDLGGVRMAVIGADLARLPARDRDIALADPPEHPLDMLLRVEFLFVLQIETVHRCPLQWRHSLAGGAASPSGRTVAAGSAGTASAGSVWRSAAPRRACAAARIVSGIEAR